jgi:hypothetical protein
MMANCPLCEAVRGHFSGSTARYSNTLIDYQAKRERKRALAVALASVLEPLTAKAIFGAKRTHSETLERLA